MEYQRLYAKVDLDAIGKNVAGVRRKIPCGTRIMAIIKANAYGHGSVALARYLEDKADYFGVATLAEAVELREAGVEKGILILGNIDPREYKKAIDNNITLTITSYANAEILSSLAQQANKQILIHIKVDTGMSRIGFKATDENAEAVKNIAKLPNLTVEGMFTHFAIADSKDKSSALKQREKFDYFASKCKEKGVEIPILHANNSAGTMELDKYYNMVRMGIMLYGLYPSEEMDKSYKLYPAMELRGHISFVKTLEAGMGIGYGHTYITDKETRVATVPCGYADGYPRALSNRSEVLIRGKRCKVLGRICMDQIMVDVSEIPDVKAGEEVVLFGKMGDECISVEELAALSYSFNYEFVCGIARRVPRVYYEGGEYLHTVDYLAK